MKYVLAALLMFGLAACAKSAPPPKAAAPAPIHNASTEDCNRVYERILAISLVQNLDPDKLYSKPELEAGAMILDQVYTQSGRKRQFFGYCTTHINVEQVSCMLGANTFEDMDLCDKLFATKKVSK